MDLILVLDTSGSVYEIFEDQKILALEILDSFPEDSYKSRLQVLFTPIKRVINIFRHR